MNMLVAFVKNQSIFLIQLKLQRAIEDLDLPPSRIDIGKLTYEYHLEDNKYNDAKAFVIDKLKTLKTPQKLNQRM